MRLLLFCGAGASVELGVPAMQGLAREFMAHSERWGVEPEMVRALISDPWDLEALMDAVDKLVEAGGILEGLGAGRRESAQAAKIRSELEWFVQHAAERIDPRDAELIWEGLVRSTEDHEITFVTTNYDRAIEMAARAAGVVLDDGFVRGGEGEVTGWVEFERDGRTARLVKVHGSTDWYRDQRTKLPRKVRHPLALFGRLELQVETGQTLVSSLVLPARDKLKKLSPYPRLTKAFLDAVDQCECAVFLGSSFRDEEVLDAARSTARRVPTFVVGPGAEDYGLDPAQVIRQTASLFLISTLPNALGADDPPAALSEVGNGEGGPAESILPLVRALMSEQGEVEERCTAASKLEGIGATLGLALMERLLKDKSARVAQHALGLIPASSRRAHLVAEASRSAHVADEHYQEDLEILRNWPPEVTSSGSGIDYAPQQASDVGLSPDILGNPPRA